MTPQTPTELKTAADAAALTVGDEIHVVYESKYADRGNEQEFSGVITKAQFTLTPEQDGGYLCASFFVSTDDSDRADKLVSIDATPTGDLMIDVKTRRRSHDARTRNGLRARSGSFAKISAGVGTVRKVE